MEDDKCCEGLLRQENKMEALAWLRNDDYGERNIGELSPEESLKIVEELYQMGAQEVVAVELELDVEVSETTDELVVLLPSDKTSRKRLIDWGAKHMLSQGFDPIQDVGQRYMYLAWD